MFFIFTVPNVRISVDPPGIPVPGQGFQYFVGTNLSLSCLVTPPPPIDIEYRWICSTGCFANMETSQNISVMGLNVSDSGVIHCVVNVIEVDFISQSFELQVIMIGKEAMFIYVHKYTYVGMYVCTLLRICMHQYNNILSLLRFTILSNYYTYILNTILERNHSLQI